ncbi:hypothetical protein BV20DRAFT_973109 [Pilatotrama ljubarskyi]|nr:hypothetical protein BV20DRAFT_973109 [Pilatotrama ljubarskyi]
MPRAVPGIARSPSLCPVSTTPGPSPASSSTTPNRRGDGACGTRTAVEAVRSSCILPGSAPHCARRRPARPSKPFPPAYSASSVRACMYGRHQRRPVSLACSSGNHHRTQTVSVYTHLTRSQSARPTTFCARP